MSWLKLFDVLADAFNVLAAIPGEFPGGKKRQNQSAADIRSAWPDPRPNTTLVLSSDELPHAPRTGDSSSSRGRQIP
jgi:hypothetical protein